MKLSIRLQQHGKVNHPLWWIVVAPKIKNIRGPFIEHLGYWYPMQKVVLKRQIILNIMRIKYWISCGAVPTKRVQYFLHYFGVMPKPWYYEKSEEELAKQNNKEGEELTDKKKMKMEEKIKKKARRESPESISVTGKYFKNKKKYLSHLAARYDELLETHSKENDYLRELLMEQDFQHYVTIKKLSGGKVTDIGKVSDKIRKLRAELQELELRSAKMHPVKRAMLINRINELMPQLEEETKNEQNAEDEGQSNPEQAVLGRAAMHELIIKRLEKFNDEMNEYYKLLEPLTMESYAEYLMANKGLSKAQAESESTQFFESIEALPMIPTLKDALEITEGKKERVIPLNEPSSQDSEQENYEHEVESQDKDFSFSHFMQSPIQIYKAAVDGVIIPPSMNPVNPYPDLKKYVPEDYFEIPHNKMKIVQVPALQPEEQLERYRAIRSKKKTQ